MASRNTTPFRDHSPSSPWQVPLPGGDRDTGPGMTFPSGAPGGAGIPIGLPSTGVPPVGAFPTVTGSALGTTAGGLTPEILKAALKFGGVPAIRRLLSGGGSSNTGGSMGGASILDQLSEILGFAKTRLERSDPVHEAAMHMAMRMAPSGDAGRVQQASQTAMGPRPQQQTDPRVLDAIARLMGR